MLLAQAKWLVPLFFDITLSWVILGWMFACNLPLPARSEGKPLSWKKFRYISISSHLNYDQKILILPGTTKNCTWTEGMRPLMCVYIYIHSYIYIKGSQRKGSPGRWAQGLARRGSCFIFEQPRLSIAEVWPNNVIWRSSAWHICFHSKRSCSPRAGSRGREAALKPCLHLSGAKSHKGEKFPEILNWRWHGGFGLPFSQKQNQRWNLWLDLNPFYITP